jgi:hypothetical protein
MDLLESSSSGDEAEESAGGEVGAFKSEQYACAVVPSNRSPAGSVRDALADKENCAQETKAICGTVDLSVDVDLSEEGGVVVEESASSLQKLHRAQQANCVIGVAETELWQCITDKLGTWDSRVVETPSLPKKTLRVVKTLLIVLTGQCATDNMNASDMGQHAAKKGPRATKVSRGCCTCNSDHDSQDKACPQPAAARLLSVLGFTPQNNATCEHEFLACESNDGLAELRSETRRGLEQNFKTLSEEVDSEQRRRENFYLNDLLASANEGLSSLALDRGAASASSSGCATNQPMVSIQKADVYTKQAAKATTLRPSVADGHQNAGCLKIQLSHSQLLPLVKTTNFTTVADVFAQVQLALAGSQGDRISSASRGRGQPAMNLVVAVAGGSTHLAEGTHGSDLLRVHGLFPGPHRLLLVEANNHGSGGGGGGGSSSSSSSSSSRGLNNSRGSISGDGRGLGGGSGSGSGSAVRYINASGDIQCSHDGGHGGGGDVRFLRVRWEHYDQRHGRLTAFNPASRTSGARAPTISPIVHIKNLDGEHGLGFWRQVQQHAGRAHSIRGHATATPLFSMGSLGLGPRTATAIDGELLTFADNAMAKAKSAATEEAKRSLERSSPYFYCTGLLYGAGSTLPRHVDALGTWVVLLSIGNTTDFFIGNTVGLVLVSCSSVGVQCNSFVQGVQCSTVVCECIAKCCC